MMQETSRVTVLYIYHVYQNVRIYLSTQSNTAASFHPHTLPESTLATAQYVKLHNVAKNNIFCGLSNIVALYIDLYMKNWSNVNCITAS